jgi:hypothetical protein
MKLLRVRVLPETYNNLHANYIKYLVWLSWEFPPKIAEFRAERAILSSCSTARVVGRSCFLSVCFYFIFIHEVPWGTSLN